jgi:hypothetical protein
MKIDLESIEIAILERSINPDRATWTPDASRSILKIGLTDQDAHRRDELADRAREGTISADEATELGHFHHVGRILEMMKAKARISLKKANLAP